jgi:hypothetical protein
MSAGMLYRAQTFISKFVSYVNDIDGITWGRNVLLRGTPLLIAECRTLTKSVWPIKTVSRKFTFRVTVPSACTVIFLNTSHMQFSLLIFHNKLLKCNTVVGAAYGRTAILCYFVHIKGPYISAWMLRFTGRKPKLTNSMDLNTTREATRY